MNIKELIELAKTGDSESAVKAGEYYLQSADEDNYVDYYNKAFNYFKDAASLGNPKGLYNLGICYENGIGVKQDKNKAIAYFIESANDLENENPKIQTKIASCYASQQDFKSAIKWYLKASEHDDCDAFNALGYIYLNGLGIKKDVNKAIEYLTRSNEDPYSINLLGTIYSDENSEFYNPTKALDYFAKSAALGYPYAMLNASEAYINGTGCDFDFEKAIEYLLDTMEVWSDEGTEFSVYPSEWQMSAHEKIYELKEKEGFLTALENIARRNNRVAQYYMYTFLNDSFDFNNLSKQKENLNCLIQSADNGFQNAQYELGTCYNTGTGGCERNIKKALLYLSAAAEQGHSGAAFYLQNVGR